MIIKLYAYLENNFGDDLMVDILLKRYPQHTFYYVDWWNESDKFLMYPNFVNKNYYAKKWKLINKICNTLILNKHKDFFMRKFVYDRLDKKCDCAVYIGGSIYIEGSQTDISKKIEYEKKKASGCPLFVIGANFGPYHTDLFFEKYKEYFHECGGVCFRDKKSYKLFEENEKVSYAPDVVFNLNVNKNQRTNGKIMISIINLANKPHLKHLESQYERLICDICIEAVSRSLSPVIVSFCDKEGDKETAEKIYATLDNTTQEHTEIVGYENDIDEILDMFNDANAIIATRFHAMILALVMDKPFYCIAYDQKVINVMNDIECNLWSDIGNLEGLTGEKVLDNVKQFELPNKYKESAKQQFNQLEEFIKDC